jgi:hypothetical protein
MALGPLRSPNPRGETEARQGAKKADQHRNDDQSKVVRVVHAYLPAFHLRQKHKQRLRKSLNQERLDMLGRSLKKVYRVQDTPCSLELLEAIDQADRERWRDEDREQTYGCDKCKLRCASPAYMLATEMCPQAAERRQVGLRRRSASPIRWR